MILKDKTYNVLADLARIILPAFSAFYLTLSEIWGLPYGEQISASIMALCALLGAFLKVSSNKFFDPGTITILNTLHEEDEENDAP